ncbi:hypothetical protein OS493_027878 [Desmophyllum pertusum]|uniref:G-protein coupled receptors family 1 profile domain-containing protein n=1 Tax=Desmophyllum pertusum TaxID=174260 RepID=A0A9W9YKF2_9CNID|nr:hypothetical protein OS493_027878 [Desmophyllum pertusum]
MNHTTVNTTSLSCGLAFLPVHSTRISPELRAVFIFRIAVNALTCPLIILLNILVLVAVKTKRQLRTKSNVALACLATTDLVVGLVVQPLHITSYTLILKGEAEMYCSLSHISMVITVKYVIASLNHLMLTSAERYFAIKHTFAYEDQVTEVRIIIASGLAWAVAIIFPVEDIIMSKKQLVALLSRKTITQAEELERKIFGTRQVGVIATAEQGQSGRASREENVQQGNETLNNEHETAARIQPQEEYEETTL